MKKLLYLLCFLPFCLQAQTTETTLSDTTGHKLLMSLTEQDSLQDSVPHRTSYQSFFGKNKTVWTLASWVQFNFCPSVSDSLDQLSGLLDDMESSSFVSAVKRQQKSCLLDDDTINYTILTNKIHGKLPYLLYVNSYYLKYASDTFTYNGHAYRSVIGEDTVNGRLYRLYNDSIEALWCDMSLTLGDTFRLPNIENYNGKGRRWIVDSVYYLDNRKIIRFELIKNNSIYATKPWWHDALTLYFIEGIGPTCGPLGRVSTVYDELPFLLCVYKDDTLDFMTSSALGCEKYAGPGWLDDRAVKEPKRATLTLQPNPAQDYIMLRNEDASDLGGEIIITDAIGRVLLHRTMENAEMRISTGSYGYGTYFVRYRSKNGVQSLKFVKVL